MITKKYYKLIRVSHADSEYFRLTNVSSSIGELTFDQGWGTMNTLEYSTDGVNWTIYDWNGMPVIYVNPSANVYVRGSYMNRSGNDAMVKFNQDYTIGGNYMSLVDYSTMGSATTLYGSIENCFKGQTHLVSAADLNFGNVTTLDNSALYGCFQDCTGLTTPPDMSGITTLNDQAMSDTFSGCSSLTTPPDLSNVTNGGWSSLGMTFYNCTSLTAGVDLSSMTTVNTSASLMEDTYSGCSNLATVTAPNTQDLNETFLYGWLSNAGADVTGTKTVRVPTGATITTDSDSGIPTGWTRVDY